MRMIGIDTLRITLIQVDAYEIDHPHQRSDILDHRKVDDVVVAMIDRARLDPLRSRHGCALHEEKVAVRTVRIALHHHCPILDVRQQVLRHVGVVLQQITLRDVQLGPERFVEIGQANRFAFDGDVRLVRVGWNRDAHRGSSLGGRWPLRNAPATGTYVSSLMASAQRNISPPRLMSPRPTNSCGNSSRSPKTSSRTSTYLPVAILPSRMTSTSP